MHTAELFQAFKHGIESNPTLYLDDYLRVKEHVAASPARYRGEPIDFLYQPMFFTESDVGRFKDISCKLTDILKKVIAEYRLNPEFRRIFGYTKTMEELVMIDPGYSVEFPVARYDMFYPHSDGIKFCELNSDGASSMQDSMMLHDILSKSHLLDSVRGLCSSFDDYELFDSWIDCLIQNYIEFAGTEARHPNVAIMDFEGEGIISEFAEFKRYLVKRGFHTIICDPRELKYTNGRLYWQDTKIDLIYRRAVTARLVEEAPNIQDFIKAYKDGNVCVVGGLVSQIIHNKILFAILHDESHTAFLSPDEKKFVKNHIPYTAVLTQDNPDLIRCTLQNKDTYLLKPFDLYAARGVYMGKDVSQSEWSRLVNESIGKNYLVQEFCTLPKLDMLFIEDGKAHFEACNYMIGLFMYNQKFSGIYTRVGRKNIIASIGESFSLPNFIVR